MRSVWSESTALPVFESLKTDIKTDVLVIGGGICGILCAYMLGGNGVSVILAEASKICSGITKNTTAKITSQHGLIYSKLIRQFGKEKAELYLKANQDAVAEYRKMCGEIECGFQEKDAFVYSVESRQKIEEELEALARLNFNAESVIELPLPFKIAGAVKFEKQAQFNPLEFIAAIATKINIFEDTPVREVRNGAAITDHGNIYAEKIIVATHFPIINKYGLYFLKQYQDRSYVIALKNVPDVGGMYIDEAQNGLSFRNYKDMLLIGGGSHRTGKQGGNWQELTQFAHVNYPDAQEVYRWATQDCMSLDGVPYIGQYAKNTPNLYVATGFNKWGMTSSMVAAKILADLVQGRDNQYAPVFDPSRTMLRAQLAVNAAEATMSLLTPTAPRCPHMGCALKWNKQEKTWDCSCHGSRFTKEGGLIDNPAMHDLNSSE